MSRLTSPVLWKSRFGHSSVSRTKAIRSAVTGGSPLRRLYRSGGPWEDAFGYSRAIRTGDRIIVSGCTSVVKGAVLHPGDAGAQMRLALMESVGYRLARSAAMGFPAE